MAINCMVPVIRLKWWMFFEKDISTVSVCYSSFVLMHSFSFGTALLICQRLVLYECHGNVIRTLWCLPQNTSLSPWTRPMRPKYYISHTDFCYRQLAKAILRATCKIIFTVEAQVVFVLSQIAFARFRGICMGPKSFDPYISKTSRVTPTILLRVDTTSNYKCRYKV